MINTYLDIEGFIIEAQVASILAYYTQGQGLISQRRNNSSYFYHYDGLGSTKALTDANQNIQSSAIYDAWGNILQSSGTITNPYLYVGELGYYGDGDAGMYLLTQRWYNPLIGRFVVRDPIGSMRIGGTNSLNLYTYCENTPPLFTDPTGMISFPFDILYDIFEPIPPLSWQGVFCVPISIRFITRKTPWREAPMGWYLMGTEVMEGEAPTPSGHSISLAFSVCHWECGRGRQRHVENFLRIKWRCFWHRCLRHGYRDFNMDLFYESHNEIELTTKMKIDTWTWPILDEGWRYAECLANPRRYLANSPPEEIS